jgi:putative addiction module component (TIGR02574 family)
MAHNVSIADILTLSPAERIQLVEDIWDSIVTMPEALTLSDAQRKELDARLAAYAADPHAGSPWKTVLSRIRSAP